MAIQVIFVLIREKLDRADIAIAGFQRLLNAPIVELTIEGCGLATELNCECASEFETRRKRSSDETRQFISGLEDKPVSTAKTCCARSP